MEKRTATSFNSGRAPKNSPDSHARDARAHVRDAGDGCSRNVRDAGDAHARVRGSHARNASSSPHPGAGGDAYRRSELSGLIPRVDAPDSFASVEPVGFSAEGSRIGEADAYARARYGTAVHGIDRKRSHDGKGRFWTVVLVLAVLVFAASVAVLCGIGYGYWHGSKVYDEIAQEASIQKEADALASMTVDWDALLAQNPDTVGWIYMPNTSIDYPIVQGETDEEYLKKDFTGDSGGIVHKGSIFLSSDNAASMADQNNVIYGHNMNDDTMFAHVLEMTEQQAFDAARTFYVFTPDCNYRCMTYAADVVDSAQTSLLQFNFADRSAQDVYMSSAVEGSTVAAPEDVDLIAATKLFTLITCGDDYAATRAVLFGAVVESAVPANAAS